MQFGNIGFRTSKKPNLIHSCQLLLNFIINKNFRPSVQNYECTFKKYENERKYACMLWIQTLKKTLKKKVGCMYTQSILHGKIASLRWLSRVFKFSGTYQGAYTVHWIIYTEYVAQSCTHLVPVGYSYNHYLHNIMYTYITSVGSYAYLPVLGEDSCF